MYAYGNTISEDTAVLPKSEYAKMKVLNENLLQQFASEKGTNLKILRLGNIYGLNDGYQKILNILIKKIQNGEEIEILGDGNQTRRFLHVEDLTYYIYSNLTSTENFEIANLVGRNELTIKSLVEIISKGLGQSPKIRYRDKSQEMPSHKFDTTLLDSLMLYESIAPENGIRELLGIL